MGAPNAASAAILIGGESRRMGQDKASLVWREKSLLERVHERVASVVDEVLLVVRPERVSWAERLAPTGTRVITDQLEVQGPLVGIHSALMQAKNDPVLVVACDMPDLQTGLLKGMLDEAFANGAADVIVPRTEHGYEPLLAVYRKTCLPFIERTLKAGPSRIPTFYSEVEVSCWGDEKLRALDPDLSSLINFNRPQDFE